MLEHQVGIIEFVGTHDGFYANIKKRYSDFHVNEISPQGKILHFTSTTIPQESKEDPIVKSDMPEEITQENLRELHNMATKKTDHNLVKSTDEQNGEQILKIEERKPLSNVDIDVTDFNKQKRTEIHMFIKSNFVELDSSTVMVEDRKYIRVKRKKSGPNQRKSKRKGEEHTHFIMYKENTDTMHAIAMLSGVLRMKPSSFAFAGTKDKRGMTSQAVSAANIRPSNILNAAKPIRNVHFGDFSYSSKGLSLGTLGGNQFRIALRDVTADNDSINGACESLRSHGFLNYYGMQRFGVRSTRTSDIGREMLHYRWSNATNMILEDTAADTADMKAAKQIWRTLGPHKGGAAAAYGKLSSRSKGLIEGILLKGLSLRHANDYVGALQTLPRNTRTMYIHAYQSYVWNKVVSRRVKEFRRMVLIGDLIKGRQESCNELESEEDQPLGQKVKHVQDDSINNIGIYEVVLPLPGHSVVYPNNIIKDWYSEILAEDGFTVDSFAGSITQYTLRGAYRQVFMKPKDLSWKIVYYADECKPLIQSDLEKMKSIDISDNLLDEGSSKAVLLDFQLPPASYATMALRELTKLTDGIWTNGDSMKRKAEDEDSSSKKCKVDEDDETSKPTEEPKELVEK